MKCNAEDTRRHTNIFNLSKTFYLTEAQERLLNKGLTFIPTPRVTNLGELRGDVHAYNRQLKIRDYFQYTNGIAQVKFMDKSKWEPQIEHISSPIKRLIQHNNKLINGLTRSHNTQLDNLTPEERRALIELKNNSDIVIKPADKGSAIVIMDKQQYLLEAHRQLQNSNHYVPLTHSLQHHTQTLVIPILQNLKRKGYINTKQFSFLIGPNPPRPRKFYLLPKIHKDPKAWTVPSEVPQGRPIVSDCGSETYNIAQYIDYFLNPISTLHDSYLKDTYDFISKIKNKLLPHSAFLFTIDIVSLYTNIHTTTGLAAVKRCLDKFPDPNRPDTELLQLLEINLTRNDFTFDSSTYLQVQGTAMGKKFAPAYANIYMAEWEETLFPKCPHLPAVYYRYLDDIFGVWLHGKQHFDNFIDLANAHHEHIKVKATIDPSQIDFLDTTVFTTSSTNNHKTLHTKVFFKPTDSHALLHKTSFHPKHTFKGIIKSQIIRFFRICSFSQHFHEATQVLFKALRTRGYTRRFLRSIKTDTIWELTNHSKPLQPDPKDVIPMVTTFSRASTTLNRKIKEQFHKTQQVHLPLQSIKVISAYRRNRNIGDFLVKADLTSGQRKPLSALRKHFQPLKYLCTSKTYYPIVHTLNLKTQNMVYIITCDHCQTKYIGETRYTLLQRLKQHIYTIQKGTLNTPLTIHFRLVGVQNLRISGLEANLLWSFNQRRKREAHWIKELGTEYPRGFNIKFEHGLID